jgi:hypothetical protein
LNTPDGNSYLELMEDKQGYSHIAYFSNVNNAQPDKWLTNGPWVVTEINGYDSKNQWM